MNKTKKLSNPFSVCYVAEGSMGYFKLACRKKWVSYSWKQPKLPEHIYLAKDRDGVSVRYTFMENLVTCKNCLKKLNWDSSI